MQPVQDKEDVAKYLRSLAYDVLEELITPREYREKLCYLITIDCFQRNLQKHV